MYTAKPAGYSGQIPTKSSANPYQSYQFRSIKDSVKPGTPNLAGRLHPTAKSRFKTPHFAVGITNSAPLPMLSGQRCMMDFCLV